MNSLIACALELWKALTYMVAGIPNSLDPTDSLHVQLGHSLATKTLLLDCEGQGSVDKVAQICQKLIVGAGNHVSPFEV